MIDLLNNTKLFARQREDTMSLFDYYARINGIQSKSMFILMWLYYSQNGITQQPIIKKTRTTKQVVSATIKTLLLKEYVYVESDMIDKRLKKIKLTPKGHRYAQQLLQPLQQIEMDALSALSQEQQQQLIEYLSIFNNKLQHGIETLIKTGSVSHD